MHKLLAVVSSFALAAGCGDDASTGGGDDEPVVPGADPSFGEGGLVTVGFPGGLAGLMRVARQPDGKIVGVGGTQESILIMRVGGDGALDTSFGEGGVVELPWGIATNGVTVGYGCAIDDEGRIVIAARVLGTYGAFASVGVVARLLPDGALDPSFAGAGYVVGAPGSSALALALQPDGKIVVGGYGRLERYLPDGILDPDFGDAGVSTAGGLLVQDLVVQADGAIVTVGGLTVARFTPAGDLDLAFDGDGMVVVPGTGSGDTLYGVALDEDGYILASGAITPGAGEQAFWIGRYAPDGTPDASFGAGGHVTGDDATTGVAFGVGVDGAGRIVGSGYATLGGAAGRSARFDAAGDPDSSFGAGGAGALFQDVLFSNVVFEPDGSITVAGAGFGVQTTFAPVFARTTASGAADGSFGEGGETKLDVGGSFDRGNALAFQPDGKVLLGGWANTGGGPGVVRLEENGRLDATFAEDGTLLADGALLYVNALAVQGDRILVGGLSGFGGSTRQLSVLAYDDVGVLDPSFGVGGIAAGEVIAGLESSAMNLAVAADGSIAIVGQTATAAGGAEFGVLRLDPDGARVASFGDGGAATSGFGEGYHNATHAVFDASGGLIVLGLSGSTPTLVRFDAAGALDAGFGVVAVPEALGMLPFGLALDGDGRILVVAGSYQTGAMQVVRFTGDGALDASFGAAGVAARTFRGNDYYGLYAFMGLVVLDDGRIVVGLAEGSEDGLVEHGLLLRLTPDGAPDESLGPDGLLSVPIGRGSTSIHALGVDAEGRLVAVGRTWVAGGGSDLMALRFVAE